MMAGKLISEGKQVKKYTVQEVLGSLYWETVDADGDRTGYMYITSTINGSQIKIEIDRLLSEINK